MQSTKKVIQRNLPLTAIYTFVSARYISIFDGGCSCENCGKLISNVVTVKNEFNRQFSIGTDCAKTLTSLQNNHYFKEAELSFNEGKSIRAKYLNHIKKGNIIGAYFWTSKQEELFIVYQINRGGTFMQRIMFPEITIKYLADLEINFKPKIKQPT